MVKLVDGAVEVRPAVCWTCDKCGRDNFGRYSPLGIEADDREAWENGDVDAVLKHGTMVACGTCHATFWTTRFNENPDGAP